MIDTWNPAVLNETTQAIDSWNPAELNQVTTKVDSWNPAILNKNLESSEPVFSAAITASFPEGATCTATDGTTTLTADDNPMAFSIPNEGTWAVACVANGVTFSENVVITTNEQTETVDLTPVGDTYATTDSVPVLIACAGIGDSEITTIAGALADVETLTAILESENAVDYLVRSTTFASAVTADSVAMTYIGANNYASNTLLDNSTWCEAICNSTYFESVLNVKVPTMTSATTPSGEVTADSYYPNREPYMAFSGSDSDWWTSNKSKGSTGIWIQYAFTSQVQVNYLRIYWEAGWTSCAYKVLGSNDGNTFVELGSYNDTVSGAEEKKHTVTNNNNYTYYRVEITNQTGSNNYGGQCTIQFYGRVDV